MQDRIVEISELVSITDNSLALLTMIRPLDVETLNAVALYSSRTLFVKLLCLKEPAASNIIEILGDKLTPETLDVLIFGENFALIAQLLTRNVFNPFDLSYQFPPIVVDEVRSQNSLRWLAKMPDGLVLKLVDRLTKECEDKSSYPNFLSQAAWYNPLLFNALIVRLAKIETWQNTYQRIQAEPLLLHRLDVENIKSFLFIDPELPKKILKPNERIVKLPHASKAFHISFELSRSEDGYFREDKAYREEIQLRYAQAEYEVAFISASLSHLNQEIRVPPLVDIIADYCVTRPPTFLPTPSVQKHSLFSRMKKLFLLKASPSVSAPKKTN